MRTMELNRQTALKGGLLLLVLAAAWILPPAVHKTLHYCPIRPDGVGQAEAVPAFARKYGFSCMQCHTNWPLLNEYGRQFKMNGYVPSRDGEEGVLKSKDATLWIEKNFPISVVVRSRPFDSSRAMTYDGAGNPIRDKEFKMQPVQDVDAFVAGGDVAHHVSWFGEADANSSNNNGFAVALGDLQLGYHPSEYFNLIGARRGFFVMDPYQTISNFGSPTIKGRATSGTEFSESSLSQYTMDQTAQTIYGYGEVGKDELGYLYYAAGVQADKGNDQGAGGKLADARLAFDTLKGIVIGAFGTFGHAGVSSNGAAAAAGTVVDRTDVKRGGLDCLIEKGPFSARAAGLLSYDHDNAVNDAAGNAFFPLGNTRETNRAAYLEAQYVVSRGESKVPFLIPLVRQNWYTTSNGKRQFGYFTAQVAHYFAPNVKGFIEESWDTKQDYLGPDAVTARRPKGSRLTAQMEFGF
jgi:hypothetical protein